MADDAKRKSPKKTPGLAVSPINGATLPAGNPGNSGGKKGRSGRPPGEFRDFLHRVRQDPKVRTAFRKAAQDPDSRGFAAVLRILVEYDRGITLVSPEVQVLVRQIVETIASRATWDSKELLDTIEPFFK